jgi:hypothetical protein
VVRVTTRFPVRQTAPVIAPTTVVALQAFFNNAAKSTTVATYASAVVRARPEAPSPGRQNAIAERVETAIPTQISSSGQCDSASSA